MPTLGAPSDLVGCSGRAGIVIDRTRLQPGRHQRVRVSGQGLEQRRHERHPRPNIHEHRRDNPVDFLLVEQPQSDRSHPAQATGRLAGERSRLSPEAAPRLC